jgi:hypothetical protein
MDKELAALHGASLPKSLWGEAIINANNIRYDSPSTRSGEKTPFEQLQFLVVVAR